MQIYLLKKGKVKTQIERNSSQRSTISHRTPAILLHIRYIRMYIYTYMRQNKCSQIFFAKDLLVKSSRACRAQALQKEKCTGINQNNRYIYTPNMVETKFPNLMRFSVTTKRLFMFQLKFLLCFTWQCSHTLCFNFDMLKHFEYLYCFSFSLQKMYICIKFVFEPIKLNKHNFVIATIIISNMKNCYFPSIRFLFFSIAVFQICTAYTLLGDSSDVLLIFFEFITLNTFFSMVFSKITQTNLDINSPKKILSPIPSYKMVGALYKYIQENEYFVCRK